MPRHARTVIIGAGIVGCSAAYHLTQLGWRDILVLDQGPLGAPRGSTAHAPGLIFQSNSSRMMTEFAQYSVALYGRLHHGGQPAFYPVGGIEVAYTPQRMQELQRKLGTAKAYGLEADLLTPAQVAERIPLLDPRVIRGGYFVPGDGDAVAVRAVAALAEAAGADGAATFQGGVQVIDIEIEGGRVQALVTSAGRIRCESVLLCTNIWSPVLAAKVGLTIPLMAVEHLYAITTPVAQLAGEEREIVHPILRHQDHAIYFRQHSDRYGIGSYNHPPLLVEPRDVGAEAKRPFTPHHFAAAWHSTVELLPPLAATQLETRFNGMFAFTTDGMPILGEAPTAAGLWVAVGVWVTHAGGVGRAIAAWMATGQPGMDLREAELSRFHPHVYSRRYIELRCAAQYDEVYDIIHPQQSLESPRNLRVSPFFPRLQEQEAVFFENAGWERPQWLEGNADRLARYGGQVPERIGWEARYWSPIQGAEHLATREGVALFDLTAFTKIEVTGPGALAFLERVAANRIDRPVGKLVYTSLLNPAGGIVADLTVTRLGPDRFWVLTGGGVGPHDLAWLRSQAPTDGSVQIEELTSGYCAVGLWGPRARAVLQRVCDQNLSHRAFPYFTAQTISIDTVPALALRLSFVGELGWELYAPTEYGLRLWDSLWAAGEADEIVAAGGGAFDSLRLEKGYRLWGSDIHTDYTPLEAGLAWAVAAEKGDFIGREAFLRQRAVGVQRQLCCLTLDEPGAVALGKEPIVDGEQVLGYVTSANYGYSVGRCIVYGYLPVSHAIEGRRVQVIYFGRSQAATVCREPLYDPGLHKLRV